MSHNRQLPDSLHSTTGGRYRNSSGNAGGGREWDRNYRDRSGGGGPVRHVHGGSAEGGVVRDRVRSHSVDRGHRNPASLPGSDTRGGSAGYGRMHQGRWQHEGRHRGMDYEREKDWDHDRDRATRDRDRVQAGSSSASRYNDKYSNAGFEGAPPPPPGFSMRHSTGPRGYEPPQPPAYGRGGGGDGRGRFAGPSFMRRSTEPSELLEEGELEFEDRKPRVAAPSSYRDPNASLAFHRSYTTPNDLPVQARRGSSVGFRPENRRSPLPSQSQQHAYSSQNRQYSRRSSPSGRPGSRQGSRNATPSPKRQPTYFSESPRTMSPERSLSTRESRPGTPASVSTSRRQSSDKGSGAAEDGTALDHTETAGVSIKPEVKDSEPQGENAVAGAQNSQNLQSRISDIDREIAACHEKLVMISGNPLSVDATIASARGSQPLVGKSALSADNDRAVPTSPPLKTAPATKGAQLEPAGASKSYPAVSSITTGAGATTSGQTAAEGRAETDLMAPVVPQDTSEKAKPDPTAAPSCSSGVAKNTAAVDGFGLGDEEGFDSSEFDEDDDAGEDDSEFGEHSSKDSLKDLISKVYAENQQKAAEMQATLAAPFLTAYPNFVPGSYPNPSDWPFWEENNRIHEKVKPHLTKILAKEKRQGVGHARRLQEEYSELYAKWRKRVDKLDRQREARQRGSAAVSTVSLPGSQNSSGGVGAFASTHHRRRHGSGPGNPAVDEFGFSTGPLFSASANPALATEGTVRPDDSLFTSDAVHSEAELQAIIERLQYDDARNPDFRSQRTAATIPNMVVDPKERAMLRFNNNSHYVEDPVSFYHVSMPELGSSAHRRVAYCNNADPDHYWTQSEVSAFVAAYLAHPKQFGKIASYIPHKSMNDCVLFYYRNKKPLRLKALEAKSNKRARRSRQSGSAGGGGRKRKEKARERRERRAREEREKLAMEAAAGCAPDEYTVDTICSTPVDDGAGTNVRTSALPSDDEGAGAGNGSSSITPAEATDILERRSKSSALLRSIIAANRQRKSEAAVEGGGLLEHGSLPAAGAESETPVFTPANETTGDNDIDDEQEGDGDTATSGASRGRRGRESGLPSPGSQAAIPRESPDKHRRRPNEEAARSAATTMDGTAAFPQGVPISDANSRSRHSDRRVADDDAYRPLRQQTQLSQAHLRRTHAGNGVLDDDDGEMEEGEEAADEAAVHRRRSHEKGGKSAAGASSRGTDGDTYHNAADDDDDDDEEEGELVEDEHWEPRRRSRQQSELNAYAMGGSIVRTRRSREAERGGASADSARCQTDSGGSDDEQSAAYHNGKYRRTSLATSNMDEDEEIVEASGTVVERGSAAVGKPADRELCLSGPDGGADAKPGPKLVSRKSSSRFGATLTAIIDPLDLGATNSSGLLSDLPGDIGNDGALQMWRQHSRQKSSTPISPTFAIDRHSAKERSCSPPKESALDRYVAEEQSVLKRPISSYETLMMCASATNTYGNASPAERDTPVSAVRRTTSGQSSANCATAVQAQLEAQVDSEAGDQETVLVGAASWLREDRRRVLRAFHKLGADFAQVASLMPTKSMAQCRYFYYHYRTPTGRMVSEIIPATLSSAVVASSSHPATGRHSTLQATADGLALPLASKTSGVGLVLPHGTKHKQTNRAASGKSAAGSVPPPLAARAGSTGQLVLPASMPVHAADSIVTTGRAVKRQRTKSPVNSAGNSSDDEDDETPLAAQLAEALAAQAAAETSQSSTPVSGHPPLETSASSRLQHPGGYMQRRVSEIAQVRPDQLNPQIQPVASLVLPSKPIAKGPSTASTPSSAGPMILPMPAPSSASSVGVAGGSVAHGSHRTPSPLSASLHSAGAMTAKKSGYSSYWSVHERSAFMYYIARLGQDWQALAEAIGSKTGTQVRNYFRANREKLNLDAVVAEHRQNKAAGTLPPFVPFPAAAPSSASGSHGSAGPAPIPGSASNAVIGSGAPKDTDRPKKEKRGRKRKTESRTSPATQAPVAHQGYAAASGQQFATDPGSAPLSELQSAGMPMSQAQLHPSQPAPISAVPNTAPATMTSFPTMGIDGGRAVVYTRQPISMPGAGAGSPNPQFSSPVPGLPAASSAVPSHMYSMSPAGQTQQLQQHPSQTWSQQKQQPLPPSAQLQSANAPDAHIQPPPIMPMPYHASPYSRQQQQQQQQQQQGHYSLPPLSVRTSAVRESSMDPSERTGVAGRGGSDTPSSQPTPPPVEGLPRFSSSPAPIPLAQQQQQHGSGRSMPSPAPPRINPLARSISPAPASYSALHISNLTSGTSGSTGGSAGILRSSQHYPPPQPALSSQPPLQYGNTSSKRSEESRKMSVTKINALLNTDAPDTPRTSSADWFGESPSKASPELSQQQQTATARAPHRAQPTRPQTRPLTAESAMEAGKSGGVRNSNDDEATGMAALALASMMEADRSPPQKQTFADQRRTMPPLPIAQPQPQPLAERSQISSWPSDPLPPISASPAHPPAVSTMSAFSPVAGHGSPPTRMVISPPTMHPRSRPSSVGPPTFHHQHQQQQQYPNMPRSHAMSPPRALRAPSGGNSTGQQIHAGGQPVTMAQTTALYASRSSMGYAAPHHGPLPRTPMPPLQPSSTSADSSSRAATALPPPPHLPQIAARQPPMHHHGSSPPHLAPRPSVSAYPGSESAYPPRFALSPPAPHSGPQQSHPPYTTGQHASVTSATASGQPLYCPPPPHAPVSQQQHPMYPPQMPPPTGYDGRMPPPPPGSAAYQQQNPRNQQQ